jgi:GT2 family glycosyltransferase/glycosyltransferase involved in cell wall biosynthesis
MSRKPQRAAVRLKAPVSNPDGADPGAPIGHVDTLTVNEVSGWCWDAKTPQSAVSVEILDDDRVIASVRADIYRADLEAAGIGTGKYGFSIRELDVLLPNVCHRLSIRRASDGKLLRGTPRWVTNLGAEPGGKGSELIEALTNAAVLTAQEAGDLEAMLGGFLGAARRLADKQKTLSLQELHAGAAAGSLIAPFRDTYPELFLPAHKEPLVSIIIPVFNHFDVTYECLKSIAENLPIAPFEIIIVDDGSCDETIFANFIVPDVVRLIRMKENSGFILSCNRGAKLARGKFLFFLNNDTLVQPGWLDALVWTFSEFPDVGIAGSLLLSADGSIQDAGGIVWQLGDAWNWGRDHSPLDPRFRFMRDADYITGAALMIRRDVFQSLKGFDVAYAPAYYEDTDIAFRVRAQGLRVVVQPASQITHLEGASAGTDPTGSGMKRFQTINRRKFYARWRDVLATHRPNGESPDEEAERGVTLRACFIDDTVPTPDQDAGSNAAIRHMRALIGLGYKVTFLPADNMLRLDPYTQQLERYGIECAYAPYTSTVEEYFRQCAQKPTVIYIHRLSNALKYAGMVRFYAPDCQILYSVADLHFLRLAREASLLGAADVSVEARKTRAMELSVMSLVDKVIVHSHHEVEVLTRLAPGARISQLAWTVPVVPLDTPVAARAGVAFIGGYRHRPNVDAAVHLVQTIMPLVRVAGKPAHCTLVGSNMPAEVAALSSPDVETAGFVARLEPIYRRVRCTVAPLRYGAGIKGKVLDSLSFGVPCVMTDMAAEGLDLPAGLRWLVASSDAEFALKIIALHDDDERFLELAHEGQAFIRENFNAQEIQARLRDILAAPVGNAAVEPEAETPRHRVVAAVPLQQHRLR